MQYATVSDGSRKEAFKGAVGAKCPLCKTDVVPKTGRIKTPHWAHKSLDTCDRFSDPETAWHRKWKSYFPEDWREVVVGNHRADVLTPKGYAIEFQHSTISLDKIRDRCNAYENLVWVVDASSLAKRIEFTVEGDFGYGCLPSTMTFGSEITIWWKYFSGVWNTHPIQNIYLHFPQNNVLLDLKSYFVSDWGRCYGKGFFMSVPDFASTWGGKCEHYDFITSDGMDIESREGRDAARAHKRARAEEAIDAMESGDWSNYYGNHPDHHFND